MFDRPIGQFVAAALFGVVASFSISLSLIATIAAFVGVVLVGIAWRSLAAVAGGTMGWGLTWVVLAGLQFSVSLNNVPDSGNTEGLVPFLVLAGSIFLTGVAAGAVGLLRNRAKGPGLRA